MVPARIDRQDASDSGLSGVKSELCARIDQLERDFRLLSVGELGRRADAVRHIAFANGLSPVAGLASGLCEALAAGGRGATIHPYIEGMRDAVCSDRQDAASANSFLAAVSVRLAG
jgi:hypothetical protein